MIKVNSLEVCVKCWVDLLWVFYFCFVLVHLHLHLLASLVLRYVWCWGTQELALVSSGQPYSGTRILWLTACPFIQGSLYKGAMCLLAPWPLAAGETWNLHQSEYFLTSCIKYLSSFKNIYCWTVNIWKKHVTSFNTSVLFMDTFLILSTIWVNNPTLHFLWLGTVFSFIEVNYSVFFLNLLYHILKL
jgi:hypothetical protein